MAALKLLKEVKNAKLFEDAGGQHLIRIDGVRLSYPFLGTPSDDENDDGGTTKKWRVVGMLPKATHEDAYKLIKGEIEKLIKTNEAKVPADKWFLSDGDDKEDENMNDHWLVTASDGRIRPKIRDGGGQVMDDIDKIDEKFYGGVWGHILIRPWFFGGTVKGKAKTFPKRISAGLNSVVFFKEDKPFGSGRIDDDAAWGDVSGAPENDPMDDDKGGEDDL